MSKHQATRQRLRRRKEMRRRARADRSRRRRLQHEPVGARARLRRREFLVGAAGTGLLLAAPSLLGSCRHDEDVAPGTLFFNFSHEGFASRTYFLTGGGKSYRLTKVTDAPDVLVRARRHNAFLRGVPDGQITHHIEGTSFATDSVTLSYVSSDIDTGAGTWSMSAVYVLLPPGSISHAYERARARTPSGPLPLSPKRAMYGIPAARTEEDLLEEQVFLDANSQAAAILGGGPDLFSLDPKSAAHIQTNHINTDPDIGKLTKALATAQFGPAMPGVSGKTNPTGWGTLTPVLDDSGQPFRNVHGTHAGRIQYIPVFHPEIVGFAGSVVSRVSTQVKDDECLGKDVTGLDPQPGDPPNPALAGAMWARHDGSTSVDIGVVSGAGTGPVMTLKQQGPQNGFQLKTSVTGTAPSPQVSLTLYNWYVRFLGIYLQFLEADGITPLTLTDIPEYVAGTIIPQHDKTSDTPTEMFIGVLGPIFTILGIPTWPGFLTPTFTVPQEASTVRILASGIGAGARNYPETLLPGEVMTGVVSYGGTAMLCAMGAAASLAPVMQTVVGIARVLAQQLISILGAAISNTPEYSAAFWESMSLGFLKALLTQGVSGAVGELVAAMIPATAQAIADDSIPIAGWILLGISVAAGVATLLETSIEIAESPWTYVNDLAFTHDLSVQINPDPKAAGFPANADQCTVTVLFDDGSPYVQDLAVNPPGLPTLPPVLFPSVPLGGMVDVSVAFYQAGTPSSARVLLGKGSTGRIVNDKNASPTITIEELSFPVDSSTQYEHQQKTALDSSGNHVWDTGAPAPTANSSNLVCGGPGLCALRDITIRQGTSAQAGYVGYAWQSQSSDPSKGAACGTGNTGQFDQLANLHTGADAQQGYLAGPCGFANAGVMVTYSLLGQGATDLYLDTSNPDAFLLRQVMLDPPAYVPPSASNPTPPSQSWGALNFQPTAMLLHPAGYLVSISSSNDKMEVLRLPPTPMDDADAMVKLLAQPVSGTGSRPGLMTAPQAVAVAADGTILVLEYGDIDSSPVIPARIQALDLGGNPKQFFPNQPCPYSLQLLATTNVDGWEYLDLAVEYGGLIYVLSQNQGTYRLDIYQPGQTGTAPLCTTMGVKAANIAVDFWRNLYALNYEVIPVQGGGTPGFTEPSISLWVPSNSCTGVNCSS